MARKPKPAAPAAIAEGVTPPPTRSEVALTITAPVFQVLETVIEGTAPLVICRFSKKGELMEKMAQGAASKSKRTREARQYDEEADAARHYATGRAWEGIHAGGFRAAMISACRLVGFKMTIARMAVFVVEDGMDEDLATPLVRIYGQSVTHTAHTRNATGVVDVRARPMYKQWACKLRIRYDSGLVTAQDVLNLIARVGGQVGIGEGRPDSKSSAGCGWGTFRVVGSDEAAAVAKAYGIPA